MDPEVKPTEKGVFHILQRFDAVTPCKVACTKYCFLKRKDFMLKVYPSMRLMSMLHVSYKLLQLTYPMRYL